MSLGMGAMLLVIGLGQPLAELPKEVRPFLLECWVCRGIPCEHTRDLRKGTRTGRQSEDHESDKGGVERSLDVSLGLALTDFVHEARNDLAPLFLVGDRTIPQSQCFMGDEREPLLILGCLAVVVDEIARQVVWSCLAPCGFALDRAAPQFVNEALTLMPPVRK